MTQEEKQLLLKDLSARLTYGVKVQVCGIEDYNPILKGIIGDECFVQFDYILNPVKNGDSTYNIVLDKVKPYLRPISSMTEDEKKIYMSKQSVIFDFKGNKLYVDNYHSLDYLNSIHVDYRGLIEKRLALEAPKDIYKI